MQTNSAVQLSNDVRISLDNLIEYLKNLSFSLSQLIFRLVEIDSWHKSQVHEALEQYINFLFLKKKYGHSHKIPPLLETDEVWYVNIFYTKDCMPFYDKFFGFQLRHHLQITISDVKPISITFNKTKELYFKGLKTLIDLIKS